MLASSKISVPTETITIPSSMNFSRLHSREPDAATPNHRIDRSAERQRRSVPVPLRGPAPGHAKR